MNTIFLELTDYEGNKFVVNVHYIEAILVEYNKTEISMNSGESFFCKESVITILNRLKSIQE